MVRPYGWCHVSVTAPHTQPRNRTARRGLHQVVVDGIGLRIVRGELPIGAALPTEDDLSSELGVSRTVVREAIKVLASKGLVQARPKTGTRVLPRNHWSLIDPDVLGWQARSDPGMDFYRDLDEVRRLIEPRAAGLAATRRSPDELARMTAIVADMAASVDDPERYTATDLALHECILEATHNELLFQMTTTIGTALQASRALTNRAPGGIAASIPLHERVVAALGAGDASAAEDAMRAIVDAAWNDARRLLDPDAGAALDRAPESAGIAVQLRT